MNFHTLTGRIDTKEGLKTCFALLYYSRMWLLLNLLPLLYQSLQPCILSVLNGGREKHIHNKDVSLEQHWSLLTVVNHTTIITSLVFEHLAKNDKQITFLHACPG